MTSEQIYLVMVEHQDPEDDKSGPAVVETGPGCHGLEFCQSLAQRMQESGHGKSTVGKFVPVDRTGNVKIAKPLEFKTPLSLVCKNRDKL